MAPAEIGACIVCRQPVRTPIWPNAWEAFGRQRALCSTACRSTYDPDVHWMPSRAPEVVSDDEASVLVQRARQRMASGTDARPVARRGDGW